MMSMNSRTEVIKENCGYGAHVHREDDISKNEKRCQEILECKRQIEFWRSKLDVLEKEQTVQIKLARLRLDAASTWRSLSPRDRMEKKFILAAMESKELPGILDDFPCSNLPPSIRMDKDILLARVGRDDFQAKYDEERFFVPPTLRGDKQVIMAIIPKHCSVVECMRDYLRDDDEIFETVLSSNSMLPQYVLQHFSDRIRSDRTLMLQLCACRNGISSLAFVSSDLRNNKEFMLEAIKVSYSNATQRSRKGSDTSVSCNNSQILRYASQRLQDDHDVVLAAVKKSGLNLKYASYNLRRDFTIAMAAIEENGEAFRYCLPGQAKDRLLSDRDLVLSRIIKNAPNHAILRMCLEQFKMDKEIVLETLVSGIDWSLIPWYLQNSRDFVKVAVSRNPRLYLQLPESLRKDVEIASVAIKGEKVDDGVLLEVIEQCPRLVFDRDFMLTIAKCRRIDELNETIKFSPISIRGDKEIMLEAIEKSPNAYKFCSEELSMDRDIVLTTVKSSPGYLYRVPESFLLENPDVVICAIERCDRKDSWAFYDGVCEEIWSNRDVALSWLAKFGDWLHDDFPEEFEEDEEMCLTLIRQDWTEFENISISLRNSKEFMRKALAVDARVVKALDDSGNELRYDDDLTLLAFSKDKRSIQFYSGGDDFEYMVSFTERLRKRIRDYDTFNKVFVANIPRSTNHHPDCCLSLLNQGPDAMKYHSDLIASYLGLPESEELQMLHAASNNLLHWGF